MAETETNIYIRLRLTNNGGDSMGLTWYNEAIKRKWRYFFKNRWAVGWGTMPMFHGYSAHGLWSPEAVYDH